MVREDLRFDATLGSHQDNVVSLSSRDVRERERGHEVAAGAAAGDEKPHRKQLGNADCGVRNFKAGVAALSRRSNPTFTFRNPHSAIRI